MKLFNAYEVASLLVFVSGILPIISVFAHHFRHQAHNIIPFGIILTSRLLTLGLGFLLVYLAFQLLRRKIFAWWLSVVSLVLLIIFGLLHATHKLHLLLYAIVVLLLLISRRDFSVKSDNLSLRRGVVTAVSVLVVALAYGTVGFYLLDKKDFNIDFTLWQSVKFTLLQILTFQSDALLPNTEHARLFIDSLDLISLVTLAIVVSSLFKPIRFVLGVNSAEHKLAQEIVAANSDSTEDFFKLWPEDKHYFFNAKRDTMLAYKTVGSTAFVLDGPTGKAPEFKKILIAFANYCDDHGWVPCIIHGNDALESTVASIGYKQLLIGREALVDIDEFAAKTFRSKHFRYVANKAAREDLEFEYWAAPLTDQQLDHLRAISRAWIGRAGRREYTFIMGYFSEEYLGRCDVAVVKRGQEYLAYTNLIPSYITEARSIDHMRFKATMPSVGMHFLLMQLILKLHETGVQIFNLGLSPLSGIEEKKQANIPERLLKTIKLIGGGYYSFDGLEQFKNKFEPKWEKRYIYYKGASTNLFAIANNFNRAINIPSIERKRRAIIILLSALAAACYLSFPLGYIVGGHMRGLASDLGANGQPYAWLFNILDIISGCLMIAVATLSYRYGHFTSKKLRYLATVYALAGIGNALAALAPLPVVDIDSLTTQSALHFSFSFINGVAIIAAATLYCFIKTSARVRIQWLMYCGLLLIMVTYVLLMRTSYGPVLQRMYILFVALWIFILGKYLAEANQIKT